jgi:hypothetical protein
LLARPTGGYSAKREETKAMRLAEAIRLLAAGKKLGVK